MARREHWLCKHSSGTASSALQAMCNPPHCSHSPHSSQHCFTTVMNGIASPGRGFLIISSLFIRAGIQQASKILCWKNPLSVRSGVGSRGKLAPSADGDGQGQADPGTTSFLQVDIASGMAIEGICYAQVCVCHQSCMLVAEAGPEWGALSTT